MNKILLIGIGGFIGAILRYLLGGLIQESFPTFPVGTLVINFTGTFMLGLIMFSSEYLSFFDDQTRAFLTIGIMGAYTTMSTFSYESFKLLEEKENLLFAANVIGTVVLMLFAVYLAKITVIKLAGG